MTSPQPVAPIGPADTDEQLAAWRDAITHARLPEPGRTRWQASRAGLVNLWEFDVAEYWFADGRAQFVGANQSGKSTLMALTTLTLLAGALDRQYIDTFGQSDKSFRYYVEPTDDPRDRRDATAQTNRGWAWIEFSRLDAEGAAEYFTVLLYAQAKRGVSHMPPTWIICRGSARVRDGIDLAVGLTAAEPQDLRDVNGLTIMENGAKYVQRIATELFGLVDTSRYATVLEMLKVLRTPHLGQRLDPDWFTQQIRAALPPIAEAEVEELAAAWQELEQLGRERDHAVDAREAVLTYLAKAWRPWVDALLRARADAVISAEAAVTTAESAVVAADEALDLARRTLTAETEQTEALAKRAERAQVALTQLLRSDAYRDATGRTQNAERLRVDAEKAEAQHQAAQRRLARVRADEERAQGAHRDATSQLEGSQTAASRAVDYATDAVTLAALGDNAADWVAARDVDRIDAAIVQRRSRIAALRRLLREAADKKARWQIADQVASRAHSEWSARERAVDAAETSLTEALQRLSDGFERWAVKLGDDAPSGDMRGRWIAVVTAQTSVDRPRAMLKALVTREWLEPTVAPLTERTAELRAAAETERRNAADADREADNLAKAGDPQPPVPHGWTRRVRPPSPGEQGAPLWRLLDPIEGLPETVLDRVEAALAAAGLLDAWVTPDGVWNAEREGDDIAITTHRSAADRALAAVLQPAEDAGALAPVVGKILGQIGYTSDDGPLTAEVAVAADGRWRTQDLAGRAGPAEHGAELIGTAARSHARRRRIGQLREEADRGRQRADSLTAEADGLRSKATSLRNAAEASPDDADVVAAAIALGAAAAEEHRARDAHSGAEAQATTARGVADDAVAVASRYATEQRLPVIDEQLDAVGEAVNAAASASADLRLALGILDTAEQKVAGTATSLENAETALEEARAAERDAAAAAQTARIEAAEAAASIDRDDREQLSRAAALEEESRSNTRLASESRKRGLDLAAKASTAQSLTETRRSEQATAVQIRDAAVAAWWVPVESGFAEARDLPAPAGRDLAAALEQSRIAVRALRPPAWPEKPDEKDRRVSTAQQRAFANPRFELQAKLEASGGRSVIAVDADEANPLPTIMLIVDASGTQLPPNAAIEHLDELAARLTASHDEKQQQMYTELLSSTFVDHLADRLTRVIELLKDVNAVLDRHPTGANKTKLRLVRRPSEGQRYGFNILEALEKGTIDSPASQEQIRLFLGDRLGEARETGVVGTNDWVQHLARLLDYRAWFDIVPEFRIGDSRWRPLTKQVHSVDSGGGKVVTLLQPLLATLVTLYAESTESPRPLWLDEAFTGVDTPNRSTMLRMMVDFDFDFLLAGPTALVTAAQVPAAAVWTVARAPAPMPGVDLSLMLWTGQRLEYVPVGDTAAATFSSARPSDDAPDLFTSILTVDETDPLPESGTHEEEQA